MSFSEGSWEIPHLPGQWAHRGPGIAQPSQGRHPPLSVSSRIVAEPRLRMVARKHVVRMAPAARSGWSPL